MMAWIGNHLSKSDNIKRDTFFWNAFSAVMNSFQTMLILLAITHFGSSRHSSIFVMAYAVGNLMLNIGKYGVRQYQVTDIAEQHTFMDYLSARNISCILMAVFSAAYVGYNMAVNGYSTEKAAVVLMICGLKLVEAYEDVFHGRLQQLGRLDIAGKIFGIRLFLFIIEYSALYVATGALALSTALSLATTAVLSTVLNCSVADALLLSKGKTRRGVWRILYDCFPLCLCMCLNMYIGNSPKYIIDGVVSDDVQTKFNIVFMPVFVVALLANFIFQPSLKRMGEFWNNGKIHDLIRITAKMSLMTIIIDLLAVLAGAWFGLSVLGWVYGVDLSDYALELNLFLMGSGIIALINLFTMIVTTVRCQKFMIFGYIFSALLLVIFGKNILMAYDLEGLCMFFLAVLTLLLAYCVVLAAFGIGKKQ